MTRRRGRSLVMLSAIALAVPVLTGVSERPAFAAPLSPPAIVPQPVSETAVSGSGFTLTAQTPVDVVS
ncbi:hypothetical protein ABZZ79_39715, partial [Streptomyces sp. NPDC006458]|uniref:hypothetical protein n=1 Tax=Streptomyces sp. NPDC006458 TaxID=3154302 RepID=UPI0033A4AB97